LRAFYWLLAVAALAGGALLIHERLNQPKRPKYAAVSQDDGRPAPRVRLPPPLVAAPARAAAAPAAVAAAPSAPEFLDPNDKFLNERYPNQAAPAITYEVPFTEADKEKAARAMFPEYAAMQEAVEAERKRLGVDENGDPLPK
jgi:hypothetical protein